MISLFKSLKNGNLSTFKKMEGFPCQSHGAFGKCFDAVELLESDSMPWNFSRCPDRRGTFGEMLKSETVEMLKRWNPLDWG